MTRWTGQTNCRRRAPLRQCASALAGLATLLLLPAHVSALSIELKDVAADRIERQRSAARGEIPLPNTPDVGRTEARLEDKGLASGSPVMLRIFKETSELELWMENDGVFVHFATYPVCHWSGSLGPKLAEGDKQTPEGFYTITRRQLHRTGRWRRALNLGFPNVYDQSHERSGSYILVHGGCSSIGCFAMTNPVISEIFKLASAALYNGQKHIPVHVFPFRMTDENLDRHRSTEWHQFWMNLKEGYDTFERTHRPPRVSVCENRYVIQEAGPQEGAAQGPLEPCAATAARLADLARSNGPAHQANSRQRGKAKRHTSRYSCNPRLASCRKFMALRNKIANRHNRKGRRTAERAGNRTR